LLLISDGPAFDFGTLAMGTSTNHIFVVTNNGAAAASAMGSTLAAPFGYVGGSYPGVGANCGPTLAIGASCSVNVAFTAGSASTSGALTIGYFDGAQTTSAARTITGEVTSHAFLSITDFPVQYYQQYGLGADPATFSFGAHGVGSATTHTFYVTNTGAAAATVMSGAALASPFSYPGASNAYPGSGGTCGTSLAAGAGCTVVVVFSPGGPVGSTGALTLYYNDGTGPASAGRPLAGSGTNGPLLVVQDFDVTNLYPAAWYFGTRGIGQSSTHTFYVLNTGGAAASSMLAPAIGTGFGYVGGSYPGSGGTCSSALAAGTACTVNVEFKPVATGPATGNVTIDYRDASANQLSAGRVVTGTGTNLGLLEIDEKNGGGGLVSDFGTIGLGGTVEKVFMVSNVGGGPISALVFDALGAPFSFPGGFPGAGGTCQLTLAVGATCTIVVDFTPGAAGNFSDTLAASYDDGAATQSSSRTLMGTAVDGAMLVITDWSGGGGGGGNQNPFDFGTWGIPTNHTFYVTNAGNKVASVLAGVAPTAPFSFSGGFPGPGGSCTATLAVGATCTVVVTYSGAATGAATFGVSYNDGDGHAESVSRQVVGEAAANALLTITDCDQCGENSNAFDFGVVGTSAERTFTVTNTGAKTAVMVRDGNLLVAPFGFTGTGYPGSDGTCSATLDPGQTCRVSVTFAPAGPGSYAGTLGVAYDDGTGAGQLATRALTGSATSYALLTVHDWSQTDFGGSGSFDFGTVGIAVEHTFTITNDGAQTATMMMDAGGLGNGFAWKGTSGYPGTFGTCGASLAAGAYCTVVVTFTPSGNKPLTSTMLIQYYDGASIQYVKHGLSATSTTAALLQLTDGDMPPQGPNGPNPPPDDFGTSGTPVGRTFTVTNWGGGPASMIADGGTLGNGFAWTGAVVFGGGTCGTSLAKGASCTVSVTFTPSGDGPQSSTLSIAYNDGAAAQVATRVLSGTGTTKALVDIFDWDNPPPGGFSPNNGPPFDYGVWGMATDHTFTLRNDGGGPASMMTTGGSMGTGFAFKDANYPGTTGDCGPTLAVGATCKIVVTFTPTGGAPLAGQVRVAYYDGAATRTAVRAVTATPTSRAHLTVAEYFGPSNCNNCGPYDWGTVPAGTSLEHTFTVYNTGALTATGLMPSSSLAAPFAFKGPSGYPGQGGNCAASLPSNQWCQLVLVFAPQRVGPATGSIGVIYDDTFLSPLDAERAMQGTGN
jgi:hypothetical protein